MGTQLVEQFHTTSYDKTLAAFIKDENDIIFQKGGARSGKTHGDLQLYSEIPLIRDLKGKKTSIKIVGQSVPHLKQKVIRPYREIMNGYNVDFDKYYSKTDRVFEYGQQVITFASADDDNVLGDQHDFLYINECNARVFKWDIIEQLLMRTNKKALCDYNPRGKFWYHSDLLKVKSQYPHEVVHSTFLDNEMCPEGIKRKMLNALPGTYYHTVYVLGQDGRSEGAIYTNWKRGEWVDGFPVAWGVDYGATDPDAIAKVSVDERGKKIYVEQIYYDDEDGKGTEKVKGYIKDLSVSLSRGSYRPPFICETAEQKINNDMRAMGIHIPFFAKPSLVDSIREVQNYEIILCGDSVDLEEELNSYCWKDKVSNTPLDLDNHLLDAMRYAYWWLTNKTGLVLQERNM